MWVLLLRVSSFSAILLGDVIDLLSILYFLKKKRVMSGSK